MDKSKKIKFRMTKVVETAELRCSNCKNYLSVGPVLNNSKFGNICGRKDCALFATLDGVNSVQVLYESVVQFSLFPCRYQNAGCPSFVKWGEVEEHEEICEFEIFDCPFLENEELCDWTGDLSELLLHAEISHPDREFKNSNIMAEFSELKNKCFFLNIVQNIVLILLHFDYIGNIFVCGVRTSDRIRKRLTYQIEFIDKTTLKSISTCSREAEILNPRNEKLFPKDCMKIDLKNMRNILEDLTFFDVNFRLDNNEVEIKYVKLELMRESYKRFATFSGKNTIIVSSICNYCRPTSTSESGKDVNSNEGSVCRHCLYSEKIVNNNLSLLYDRPCKNSSRGCNYVGSYFSLIEHICTYANKSCIFCNVPVENLLAHAEERHNNITNRTSNILQLTPSTKSQYILPFDGHFFFLNFEINNARGLTYEVDCGEMKEVRYVYELYFMADEAQFSAITMKSICHPGHISFEKHQISENLSKKTEIPCVILEKFFPNLKNLIFRITISKLKASNLDDPATHSVLQVNNDLKMTWTFPSLKRKRRFDCASRESTESDSSSPCDFQ
ncbi:hypothetical protein WA026_022608 [Henosepilachna vigintioctopunctata]|uniref:RING-type E3 ubiquitin transferase n=1 Tax=Henosepilachna vigintioctopunctata TaxID=420089 RepID=A0AAW1V5P9_9CUCU